MPANTMVLLTSKIKKKCSNLTPVYSRKSTIYCLTCVFKKYWCPKIVALSNGLDWISHLVASGFLYPKVWSPTVHFL